MLDRGLAVPMSLIQFSGQHLEDDQSHSKVTCEIITSGTWEMGVREVKAS